MNTDDNEIKDNCLIQLDHKTKLSIISTMIENDLTKLRNIPLETYDLNYLIDHSHIAFDKQISPLLAASYLGKIEMVIMILHNDKIDVNLSSESEGYSPIMVACFKGYYEIVRILLDYNADVNKCNQLKQTPLLFCFSRIEEHRYKYENKKICTMMIELLLKKGADLNVRIDQRLGYTVLMKMASSEIPNKEQYDNIIEIIKFLLERGADKNIMGYDNKSTFDVIKDSEFNIDMINVIKQTKQTIFYSAEKNSHFIKPKRFEVDIKIEDNIVRNTCCIISKQNF